MGRTPLVSLAAPVFLAALAFGHFFDDRVHDRRGADDECNELRSCRTMWSIVWSALAAAFSCVWVSMHPNVPAQGESEWKFVARRIELMMLGLFVPEYIVAQALSERIEAAQTAEDFELTLTHAHFLHMGGFAADDEQLGETNVPITAQDLKNNGNLLQELRKVDEKDIKDKSKGDPLSKTVAIAESLWFATQCIARGIEGFAVTELELTALAFCLIHLFMYILWWHKPRCVQRTIRINCPLKTDTSAVLERRMARRRWRPVQVLQSIPLLGMVVEAMFISPNSRPFHERLWSEHDRQAVVYGGASNKSGIYVGTAVGLVFGVIHAIAWNFHSPTTTEKWLWRASSLVMVAIPPLSILRPSPMDSPTRIQRARSILLTFISRMCSPVYIIARSSLFLIALLQLRDLPPSAFRSVQWVTLIPHV
ncbi:hypothetical protein EYR40_001534 [Pleurotus pulmonarius]|nr:hypothetical protein EYR38_004777 [Pleurotus pulmonarius]KAF4609181.1 hypothetical protein EYR40_001534 [Pleurotus pulmonarius]